MRYLLIDSGNKKKFERFGSFSLIRPCAQALWKPSIEKWDADASFSRENGNKWVGKLPKDFQIELDGLRFNLSATDFGHLGIFPEHTFLWKWAAHLIDESCSILNLFAYSGGATLAFARKGARVCHVDASAGMVDWARKNAALNSLGDRRIRWIVDDVMKFLKREVQRKRRYDGILLDPPSFGRGAKGEVFKIERDIHQLLVLCKELLSDCPKFVVCSNHTNQMTPTVMRHLLEEIFGEEVEAGELLLRAKEGRDIPTGTFARWCP